MSYAETSSREIQAAIHCNERVGIDRLDAEHIRLAELLQAATLAAHDHLEPQMLREQLSSIFAYALMHFSEEENVMASANFPGLVEHRAEHGKILERLQCQLANYDHEPWRVTLDIVDMLEMWMHDHLRRFDAEYGRFLRREL
jgi:hemerythrin